MWMLVLSFNNHNGRIGFGWCMRDEIGLLLHARESPCQLTWPITEGEAYGIYHAIIWVMSLGYFHVVIEFDCKVAVDLINKPSSNVRQSKIRLK